LYLKRVVFSVECEGGDLDRGQLSDEARVGVVVAEAVVAKQFCGEPGVKLADSCTGENLFQVPQGRLVKVVLHLGRENRV
jgi:hypothetical protein